MKVTFLGTGTSQGVPVIACKCNVCQSKDQKDKRLRSSVMVETAGTVIVIDAGPDFRYQMLRGHVQNLDAVLLTHGHKDHIGGLDDLRAFNFILKKSIDVYAGSDVQELIKLDFSYAFTKDRYPGVPQITLHNVDDNPFFINDVKITPIKAMHLELPIFGFRIGDFTYITDANYILNKELEKIRGSKVVVINALRIKEHYSHFNLAQAVDIINGLGTERGYLTHISHQMGLHEAVEKDLPGNIKLACDGLQIEIN